MSLNWERALIGTVLANPDRFVEAEGVLPSEFTGHHQLIWAHIIALAGRGMLGPRAVVEALRTDRVLDQIGFADSTLRGEQYVLSLTRLRGEEVPEYVQQVQSAATKRELMNVAALIRSEAADERMPADETLANAEERLTHLRRAGTTQGHSIFELMGTLSERLAQMQNGDFQPAWVPEIPDLRAALGFAEAEDYMLIAARPGNGKSSVLRYELGMAAYQHRQPTLLINMENAEIEITRSVLAMVSGISKARLKSGPLTDDDRQVIHDTIQGSASVPFHIKTLGAPSGQQLKNICRKYINEYGVGLIGVDYVQLMRNGITDRVMDVSISSACLRSIALDMRVPVVAAAQMSRAIENRADGEPQLSDLRESGSLEQDATVVIFSTMLWGPNPTADKLRLFPENRLPDNEVIENAVPMEFKIAKNRNGRIGKTKPVLFLKNTNQFRPLRPEEIR